jgi:hypothetical protein
MIVVVGGHSRNIGKTAVAAGLIGRLRDRRWTAVKVTQYGHGICSREGGECGCESGPEHPFALSEEYQPGRTDSGRFLAAGAERSFWLRTRAGELAQAAGVLRKLLERSGNVILESNSVLELVQPDVCLMVMDFSCRDFKASTARFLDRADAFLVIDRGRSAPLWEHAVNGMWGGKPQFPVRPPDYVTGAVVDFVGARVAPAGF